ncbi:2-keto-3-deoxy-galactonokinase [compost metagenome]
MATMQPAAGTRVALIGSSALVQRYTLALRHAGCEAVAFGDEATWAGHQAIYQYLTGTPS